MHINKHADELIHRQAGRAPDTPRDTGQLVKSAAIYMWQGEPG